MPMSADFQNRLNPLLEAVIDHFGTPFHVYDETGIRNTGEGLIVGHSSLADACDGAAGHDEHRQL